MTTRVIIADDHEILRHGLRDILASRINNVEIAEARDTNETLELLKNSTWDLLLLDINMPDRSGFEVLEELSGMEHRPPVLVLTAYPEEQFALRAFKLGASGYITKREASDQLVTAINRILSGGKYVTASLAERLASNLGPDENQPPHETLSQRELQVLRAVATGKSIKEIAEELSLSERTVATYRTRLAVKTGLKTNVEIARYALKNGLVE
ncbi:MAG: hypothetical protein RI897_2247 [Verrucomicrobiota bacterium]|jgi:DNA-binding NarL/FixJ family response regulator